MSGTRAFAGWRKNILAAATLSRKDSGDDRWRWTVAATRRMKLIAARRRRGGAPDKGDQRYLSRAHTDARGVISRSNRWRAYLIAIRRQQEKIYAFLTKRGSGGAAMRAYHSRRGHPSGDNRHIKRASSSCELYIDLDALASHLTYMLRVTFCGNRHYLFSL